MVNFYERQIDAKELQVPNYGKRTAPWPQCWTRIEFDIPDEFIAADGIIKFLEKNTTGQYDYFIVEDNTRVNFLSKLTIFSDYNNATVMVVGFEVEEDATLFKLMGGHEAWEDND